MNLLDTFIKIGVKDEATKNAQGIFDSIGSMAGKLAKGIAAAGIVSAIKDAGVAALDAGANFEQLKGGVETLFGAGGRSIEEYAEWTGQTVDEASGDYDRLMQAQDLMMQNSYNAFQTAGLSQNEYIKQVTGFSAALVSSLGGDTVEAARLADVAITDMADNANKMGTDMESIQNAYQGFAKQNYTMLDNLSLGYGGTASEMARLVKDSGVLGEAGKDLTAENLNEKVSFDKIVEAIHVVQQQKDIYGTTSKEASQTVSGSIGMVKAAFENMVTGFSIGGERVDQDINNLVNALGIAAQNIFDMLGQILASVGEAVATRLPELASAAMDYIVANAPGMLSAALTFFLQIVEGIAGALPSIIAAVPEIIYGIVSTLWDSRWQIVDAAGYIIDGLVEGLWAGIDSVINVITSICSGAVDAVKNFFGIASPSKVMRGIGGYITEGLSLGLADGKKDVTKAWDGIIDEFSTEPISVGVTATRRGGAGTVNNYNINGLSYQGYDLESSVLGIINGLRLRGAI